MNKYKPGGRCGGTLSSEKSNPTFSAEFNTLLARRNQLDNLLQASPASQNVTPITTVSVTAKTEKKDIDIILEGDY